MKLKFPTAFLLISVALLFSCKEKEKTSDMNIIYIHHSTGGVIWQGKKASLFTRAVRKVSTRLADNLGGQAMLPALFRKYNKENNRNYHITETAFPKAAPYGWENYPYDYYNIWVKNAGNEPYLEEPTLELLTKQYQVVVFKHCYPVSNIQPDKDSADINSDYKSLGNYKLQYNALRDKLHEFPDTRFILWTGAALAKDAVGKDEAGRAREFFTWVKEEWDLPGDNIHIWDFYELETEGGLYLRDEYATSSSDSHPNPEFASKAVGLIFNRIIDVIENNGMKTNLKGEKI
ncbi:MAG TPA: hypothetical protein PKL65_11230 [Bacteroidales bacterium]|nr:hypothetical protein [Bacteroidales bacterium]HNR42794.1 hypothetical protein [Bacteroidales bacterium]HPM19194.1 hypothetical protein [Bacteroidales bacterium]